MVDATAQFFADLEHDHHLPLLDHASGSLRFDLTEREQLEHWRVEVKKGDVKVSNEDGDADSVVHASKQMFDELATGRQNAAAAVLRGAVTLEGDLDLVFDFQRVFPSAPGRDSGRVHRAGDSTMKGASR